MTDDKAYKYTIGKMDTAQARDWLTDYGKEVLGRLKLAADNAHHRDGDLTQLGGRQHRAIAHRLVRNFLDEADLMIASGKSGVRLRFGHDSVVLPFSFILGVKEAIGGTDDMENLHNHFSIFRLIPMAGNVQHQV